MLDNYFEGLFKDKNLDKFKENTEDSYVDLKYL